ncbi:MAG: hypothetical protein ABIJ15_06380 [bacterium]
MSRKMLVGLCVLVFGSAVFAATTANVTLNVTPGGLGYDITTDNANIYFGDVAVAKSSAPAQKAIIANVGTAPLKLEKTITDDDAWVLAESTGVVNQCVVWCLEADTYPDVTGFLQGASYGVSHSSFSTTPSQASTLKNSAGTQTTLDVGVGATTWYRIDVPNIVDSAGAVAQAIVVQITASAQ